MKKSLIAVNRDIIGDFLVKKKKKKVDFNFSNNNKGVLLL